tara:strand:- start:80 stop:616 length:537 start_codon:yes stop_codon:yes gene_type:complete
MNYDKTNFEGLFIFKTNENIDSRGVFKEVFVKDSLMTLLPKSEEFIQDNIVYSNKNVLRGLHFQTEPYSQAKLVYVSNGKILDIAVDLRKESVTYGKYFSCQISKENNKQIYIPRGFAHGYLSLEDNTIVNYKVDNYYNPKFEKGIRFNDPILDIDWGLKCNQFIISEKDKSFNFYDW